MTKDNAKSHVGGKCPYWALDSGKECGMSKGGVCIPMPEHVKMFCLSPKYYQCRQYIRGCDLIMAQDEGDLNGFLGSRDRRRLRRYPEQLHFDLVACDRYAGPQVMNAYKAKSLDVSLGGLRVETPKEFSRDTIVSFVLDPDYSSKSLLGVGEVKWCGPSENTSSFEAGIAFSNYSTSESMREYLGL